MGVGAGWYYNTVSGDVVHASWFTSLGEAVIPGWHGPYKTEAEAIAHKGIIGAQAHPNETVPNSLGNAAANAAQNALGLPTFTNTRDFTKRAVLVVAGIGILITGLVIIGKGAAPSAARLIEAGAV